MCEETFWGGCGGVVPFWSLEDCQNSCESIDMKEYSKDVSLVGKSDLLGRKIYNQQGYVISIYEDGSVEKEFILKVPNSSANMDIKMGNEINVSWNSHDARALDPK